MIDYYKWVGLPHEIGADPDDGVAADCLVMTSKVLKSQNLFCPPLNPNWFEMARQERWDSLYREWGRLMEKTDDISNGCVYMHSDKEQLFGLGVFIDGGFLIVRHTKGVAWIPVSLIQKPNYWRVRNVAC
jgi:hypothetical protein